MYRNLNVIPAQKAPLDREPTHFAKVRLNWTPVLGTWLAPSTFRGERPRGKGKPVLDGARLCLPLSIPAPMRIMVCPAGDLFDPDVSLADIDRVFAIMSIAQRHRFTIVTVNAAGAKAYVEGQGPSGWAAPVTRIEAALHELRISFKDGVSSVVEGAWPLPNVVIREASEEPGGGTAADDRATTDLTQRKPR